MNKSIEDNSRFKIGIILVNYNGLRYNKECIDSIKKSTFKNYKIIVVDNNSTDGSVKKLKEDYHNEIEITETGKNLGFSGANNIGIKKAIEYECTHIMLLNNDTIIDENMLHTMLHTSVINNAVVCPKIYYYDNRNIIWSAGGTINWKKGLAVQYGIDEEDDIQYDKEKKVEFATGCCVLIPLSAVKKTGMLSEEYFLYYEDTDYSMRLIKAGFDIIYQPKAFMYHRVSASTGGTKSKLLIYYMTRNRLIFNKKYNKHNWMAMMYFYCTFFVKKIIWRIKKEEYIIKTMNDAIKDYKAGNTGQKKQ